LAAKPDPYNSGDFRVAVFLLRQRPVNRLLVPVAASQGMETGADENQPRVKKGRY